MSFSPLEQKYLLFEIQSLLSSGQWKSGAVVYRFLNGTLQKDMQPFTKYSLYEKDGRWYLADTRLFNDSDLLLTISEDKSLIKLSAPGFTPMQMVRTICSNYDCFYIPDVVDYL